MALNRFVSAVALGVAALLGSGHAAAANAPIPFCVNDKGVDIDGLPASLYPAQNCNNGAGQTGFTADLLNGLYNEKVQVYVDPIDGLLKFNATIVADWNAWAYQGASLDTQLNFGYDLYAVVTASGVITGANSFTATSAGLSLYLDDNNDTVLDMASIDGTNPLLPFLNVGADDYLLGTSTNLMSGSGSTSASAGTDGFAVLFDEFVLTNDAAKLIDGNRFFIAPRPFHLVIYSDGDINDGTVENVGPGLLEIKGDVSANFTVPEPGSLALAGLALLGLAAARRRQT